MCARRPSGSTCASGGHLALGGMVIMRNGSRRGGGGGTGNLPPWTLLGPRAMAQQLWNQFGGPSTREPYSYREPTVLPVSICPESGTSAHEPVCTTAPLAAGRSGSSPDVSRGCWGDCVERTGSSSATARVESDATHGCALAPRCGRGARRQRARAETPLRTETGDASSRQEDGGEKLFPGSTVL